MRKLIIDKIRKNTNLADPMRYRYCIINDIPLFQRIEKNDWDDLSDEELIEAFQMTLYYFFMCR